MKKFVKYEILIRFLPHIFGRAVPYIGLGAGLHYSFIEATFPRDLFRRQPIVVNEIIENKFSIGTNLIGGVDIKLNDQFTITNEFRYEYTGLLNQYKILIGISTI